MSAFLSNLFDKVGVPPEYFSEANLHEDVGSDSQLRRSLFQTEFDSASNVSVDTSSFSLKSAEYLNWAMHMKSDRSPREESLDTSIKQYG
jgi:hypothetical protein